MPASRRSKKESNRASKTGKITVEKNLPSNDQSNIPTSPVSDPFKDPEPSTGTPTGYELNEHEGTGGEGCSKSDKKNARKDGSSGPEAKSGWTTNVEKGILELREMVKALHSIMNECIARHNDLDSYGVVEAGKLDVLEELIMFLAFKMGNHLQLINHVRALGNRPAVTAEDLYRAGLWSHDMLHRESGNGNQQPSLTDKPNTGTDQEPSASSQASHPQKDDAVIPMSSRPNEPAALTKAKSATKIPIAKLINDGPPNKYQSLSQPSQDSGTERAGAEKSTAESHKGFLAEIGQLKKQVLGLCLNVAKYNDSSAVLTDMAADRSASIRRMEQRVGLMYLVNRLDIGDQKAPGDILGNIIPKEVSITGEGPRVEESLDAVLLDSTNLRNGNDTRVSSLDNVTHSQLDGKLTREGSSISGPQGDPSEERVEETSTTAQNISQDQRLYKEEGKISRGSLKCLSEETGDTSIDKSVHKVIEGQKLQKAESQKAGPQQDGIEPQGGLSEGRVGETSTTAQNISQDQRLYKEEGKISRGSLKCLSEETGDTSIDNCVHKVIEGQKLQKAESQKAGPQQDEIEEMIRLLQLLGGEAKGSGEFDGSSEEGACANSAEAFLRILAKSWTEQDMALGSEMPEDFKKENANLMEKMKILAAVDLQIKDSRSKVGVMQEAVESPLDQISNSTNSRSTGKALVEDAKPNQNTIKMDETKRCDSREELRPQDLADRIEVAAPSHDILRHPISIEEGNTVSGSLQHHASKYDASLCTLNPIPNSADTLSGLLATEEAALVLTSMKAQGQDKPRQPPLVDSIEDRQPTKDDVHDKGRSQDFSSSEDTWRTSQPGKQNGGGKLQGEIFKTKPQVEFERAVMEDFQSVILLSPLKDPLQPVADTSDPTPPDVAEDEGQVKTGKEREHDGKPREDDSSAQPGVNVTAEIQPGLNDRNRDSGLFANDKDDKWDKSCQLEGVANDNNAAANEISNDIIKLTAQSEIVKGEEGVVCANLQEEPSCPQSSSTAEKVTEAASDEDNGADSERQVKRREKTATLFAPKEDEYYHYGCDHPFL